MVGEIETRSGIQVISRAVAVLRALNENRAGMSLGQISERVGLPRSTVQRIVGALQDERLVIATSQGGGLRLGPELRKLAEGAEYNIVETCRPILAELTQATGETTDLSVLRGYRMIFLDQVPGTHRLRTVSSVGEVFPVTTTANGKACLALFPEAEAMARARSEWERGGETPDAEAFRRELAAIRDRGLAYDLDEHTEGVSAIGTAVRDGTGDLIAISVPIPSSRFADQRAEVEAALTRAREQALHLVAPG